MSEPRPQQYSKEVCRAAAAAVYPQVAQWLKEDGTQQVEDDEIKAEIADALSASLGEPYSTCRWLDSVRGWTVDVELVDILRNAQVEIIRAHERRVAAWVERNAIQPIFAVGAKVIFNRGLNRYEGLVIAIDARLATYSVFCQELSQKQAGEGVFASILPYEHVVSV